MKHTIPISLFSFQDIITCLTGIMIVIVLVILLELVETTVTVAARIKQEPRYQVLKERELDLQQECRKLESGGVESENAEWAMLSLPELRNQLAKEREWLTFQTGECAVLDGKVKTLAAFCARMRTAEKTVQLRLKDLEKEKERLLNVQKQIAAMETRLLILKSQIERKSRRLRFEFSGVGDRIPVLVECLPWGFRLRIHPDGKITTLGQPGKVLSREIPALKEYFRNLDLSRYYPVLLLRKGTIVYLDGIEAALRSISSAVIFGKEPLADSEECFP